MVDYETFCRIRDHLVRQQLTVAQTARALGLAHEIGSVEAGKAADLCAWRVEELSEFAYWIGIPGPERRMFAGLDG